MSKKKRNKRNLTTLNIGDTVIVKPGVRDPDLGVPIAGWQGTISQIDESNGLIRIDWNSLTMRSISPSVITRCEVEGLDWKQMYLGVADVEPMEARDTPIHLNDAVRLLEEQHQWDHLGEDGQAIRKLLNSREQHGEMDEFEIWERHLSQGLTFPFLAKVSDFQKPGSLTSYEAEFYVQGLAGVDDPYGVIAIVTTSISSPECTDSAGMKGGFISRLFSKFHSREPVTRKFALCDLDAVDSNSENHKQLRLYSIWYSNR